MLKMFALQAKKKGGYCVAGNYSDTLLQRLLPMLYLAVLTVMFLGLITMEQQFPDDAASPSVHCTEIQHQLSPIDSHRL